MARKTGLVHVGSVNQGASGPQLGILCVGERGPEPPGCARWESFRGFRAFVRVPDRQNPEIDTQEDLG